MTTGICDRHYKVGDLRRRQTSFIRPRLVCIGCGAEAPIGARNPKTKVMSLSPLLYRRHGRRQLKTGRRICVCEACLAAFIAGVGGPRATAVQTAVRESLAGLYNAMLEAEKS